MKQLSMLFILATALFVASCNSNGSGDASAETNAPAVQIKNADEASAPKAAMPEKEGVTVGDKAPFFNLKNVDGKMYSFDNILDANGEKPKGFIVTFTCNTCPYAVANEDRLVALHNKMSEKGWPVVAIQPNNAERQPGDSFGKMQERAEEKGFTFHYLVDEAQSVYPQYGASKTPEIYLVDNAERIVRYTGAIDDNVRSADKVTVRYVENAIKAFEAGEKIEPAVTKAIGCAIKGAL